MWWGHRDPKKNALPPPLQMKVDRQASEERIAQNRLIPFEKRSLMIRGLPEGVFDLKVRTTFYVSYLRGFYVYVKIVIQYVWCAFG